MAEVAAQESLAPLQMKWPWVSREAYEQMEAAWLHSIDDVHAERVRFDQLMEKFTALKLAGAVIPEPVVVRPPKEPDPVVQQINMLSAGKPGLRAVMMKQLNIDRADPLADDVEIMRKIEMGVVNEDGVPA